jgi:integrase
MTAFRRKGSKLWSAKFVHKGQQHWVKGGPWPTKKQAEKAERSYRDRITARVSDETCRSFSERWLREWPRQAFATQDGYTRAAHQFADHFGERPLAVSRMDARSWALTTTRATARIIATMYEDARDVGVVKENPFHRLRLPSSKKEVLWPSLEQYKSLLAACHVLEEYAPEFRAMIQFSAWTGIRAGEMFGLQWDDIEEDRIWVRRQRDRSGALSKPKGGKVAPMPFPSPARVLDDLPRRPDPFVFHSIRGKPLMHGTHSPPWRKVQKESGLKLRWHSLRHFAATQLLDMGLDHYAVSLQLRHSDGGQLVLSRYGHPSVDAAYERILKAFEFDVEEVRVA